MSESNTSENPSTTPEPEVYSSAWLENYHREKLAKVRAELPVLIAALEAAGIARLVVSYDGCGDSGQIEDVMLEDADEKPTDPVHIGSNKQKLIDLFYDLLEVRYEGWENNDGAYGKFVWELQDGKLFHTHNARFTDFDTTEVEGL